MASLGPVKVLSLEETYDVYGQTVRSVAKMRLTDSIKATCANISPGNDASIELEGKTWSIGHRNAAKDTWFRYNTSLGPDTKLSVSQFVPRAQWFLVPNPVVRVTQNGVPLAGKAAALEGTWDTLNRAGGVSFTMYAGGDKDYKVETAVHSVQGLSAKARVKIRQGLLHSVSAFGSQTMGTQLSMKSKLSDGIKAKTSVNVTTKILKFEARKDGAQPTNGDPRTSASIEVLAPLGNSSAKPRVIVGLKWHFD